jgi:hypothetical protein
LPWAPPEQLEHDGPQQDADHKRVEEHGAARLSLKRLNRRSDPNTNKRNMQIMIAPAAVMTRALESRASTTDREESPV